MSQTISLASRVRIPDGVLSRLLQNELVLLNLDTGVYCGLDPVGTRIWQLIQAQPSRPLQMIVDTLVEEYDVDEERCIRDLLSLVARLEENKLIAISR
jgi:hypothetical protein